MFSLASCLGIAVILWVSYQWYLFTVTKAKLNSIPTIGSDGFLTAYISAWKFFFSGKDIVQAGYDKYRGAAFKVPTLETSSRWMVVVSGKEMVEELKKATDEELSSLEFSIDLLQGDYTLGHYCRIEPYHSEMVKTGLTRSLLSRFDDLRDEIIQSFDDLLPVSEEWKSFKIMETLAPIVCRTSNRLFVGAPLCLDPEYMDIQQRFAVHLVVAASIINLCPVFLKPIIGRLISRVPKTHRRLKEIVGPTIEERIRQDQEFGKRWEGRPNDLFSWLLDLAPEHCQTVDDLIYRMTVVNLASIHSTSMTLANALLHLSMYQEYVQPLREEVEETIKVYGWSKGSMGRMHKLDSFIKESMRLSPLSAVIVMRKVLKDFTFSNGVTVPAGCSVAAAGDAMHHDPSVYEDPETFKGFRFSDVQERGEADDLGYLKQQLVSLDANYLAFGYGRHACPGRFFAANELKALLAHILLNYDLKLPDGQSRPPPPDWFGSQGATSRSAQIMFRSRGGKAAAKAEQSGKEEEGA